MAPLIKYIAHGMLFLGTFVSLMQFGTSDAKVTKLQVVIIKEGEDCRRQSQKGDILYVQYKGTLEDGTEFDSSYNRGKPFSFTLGTGHVIRGWDLGLLNMCEGEKRRLIIPSYLGYGPRGSPPVIPGDATLIFEVELIKIERKTDDGFSLLSLL